ncbi:MAG TPA: BamA/TamA family outer membrane protein [Bacteroidia bacterium]|nr:BamA/TamA family outer membrane protein [Bacteroidia bacterium]
MKKICLALGVIFILAEGNSFAQKDSSDTNLIRVLPLAYYTPETRIAFEAVVFYSFYTTASHRKSNIRLFATYTQNKQFLFILPWQVYTSGEKYFIAGNIDYRRFPEYFYGLGNNTAEAIRELYSYNALTIHSKTFKNLGNNSYVGLAVQYQALDTEIPANSRLFSEQSKITGADGYHYGALGPSFMRDTRDNILCPTQGSFFEFTTLFGLGTAENTNLGFTQINLDIRDYFRINKNITWANHVLVQFSMGDVPYRALPALGGPNLHRGYYQGRFRDKQLLLYQTEYRQHLKGRFGVVAFASAGMVYEEINKVMANNIHPAAGMGLRVKISKNDQANIRFDYSFTPDSKGFYIYFAEAF